MLVGVTAYVGRTYLKKQTNVLSAYGLDIPVVPMLKAPDSHLGLCLPNRKARL
jgi:hypothetical protein